MIKKNLTEDEKIDHIKRCEFHRGTKKGQCPLVSNKEAEELRKTWNEN